MLKLLTGVCLLVIWIGFFIGGVALVEHSSNDGDGITTNSFRSTVEMTLSVPYSTVVEDKTLLIAVNGDIEREFGTSVRQKDVAILEDGDGGVSTTVEVSELCSSAASPPVCINRSELLNIIGSSPSGDTDGRDLSTLADGDLIVRIGFIATSAAASRAAAESSTAAVDARRAITTFGSYTILESARPRVISSPKEGAPTRTIFLEVETPTDFSTFWDSADLVPTLVAVENELRVRLNLPLEDGNKTGNHKTAADGGDGTTAASEAETITYTTVASSAVCNVEPNGNVTSCQTKTAIDLKKGIPTGAVDETGDADGNGIRFRTLAMSVMRVEITFTGVSDADANSASITAISTWVATTIGPKALKVLKTPTAITATRDVTTLADGDDAGEPARWEPKRGVIDGQGCIEDGCLKYKQPYYVWTRLIRGDKHNRGGMIYFEWRGNNGDVIAGFILGWVLLLFIIMIVGFLLKNNYQRPLNGPISPVAEFLQPFFPIQFRLYWGQLVINIWIIGWCLLCFFYVWNHATINNLVGKVSRGIGGVVAALLILQLFPVSRHSLLLWVFGIPFERALAFHRRIGGWIWMCTLAHFIAIFADHMRYYRLGSPNYRTESYDNRDSANRAAKLAFERLFRWEIGYPHGPPAAGFIAFCAMSIMTLFALPYFRRNYWNVFVLTHCLYLVVYVFSWIHYPSVMVYSSVPVALYVADLLSRYIMSTCAISSRIVSCHKRYGGVTKLIIRKKDFHFEPLQYVLIKIPSISSLEWHPFSISSRAETDGDYTEFSVHIKSNLKDSWTEAVSKGDLSGAEIMVQGPFGNPSIPVNKYKDIILCTGGVGITPALSLAQFVCSKNTTTNPDESMQVQLVWSGRGDSAFATFGEELAAIHKLDLENVMLTLHNTAAGCSKEISVPLNDKEEGNYILPVKVGRPDFESIFDLAGSRTAVFACGPPPMVRSVEIAAYKRGLDFHCEVFEF